MLVNNRKAELVSQSCIDQEVKNLRECIGNVQQLNHWMYVTNGLYTCACTYTYQACLLLLTFVKLRDQCLHRCCRSQESFTIS